MAQNKFIISNLLPGDGNEGTQQLKHNNCNSLEKGSWKSLSLNEDNKHGRQLKTA